MKSLLLSLCACLCLLLGPFAAMSRERVPMPWPVRYLPLTLEGRSLRMAYIDLRPDSPAGRTVVLMHGKNFNAYYWREPARWLTRQGCRVIIPDQLGFGNSDMPDIHYSFHQLAANTRALLDTLGIGSVTVIGHSMGGMLATRFSLMYPERVERLVLEDPIGLEDYRRMVPFRSVDAQLETELDASYESYLAYQKTYYPVWKPRYDTLVRIQALALADPDFRSIAKANALTYDMIYQQPVCYEFDRLKVPTLIVVGQEDRTVVGKALIPEAQRNLFGHYPELARAACDKIPGARLVVLPRTGHIPHIQDLQRFQAAIAPYLELRD